MKITTTLMLAASALTALTAQAATTVSLANFSGATTGFPIVDNNFVPISLGAASFEVGTFDTAFAATLPDLDTTTDDQAVLDAFTSAGPSGAFSVDGLFNRSIEVDSDGSLGQDGRDLFALIVFAPVDEAVQVMVLNFGVSFPEQNDVGAASVDLGRLVNVDDVVFGGGLVNANTDSLPTAFQNDGFSQGLVFDAIPEPSTSLLAGLAGLALVARRRR